MRPEEFEISVVGSLSDLNFEDFCADFKLGGFYQSLGWLGVSEEMTTSAVRYIIAKKASGELAGVLPLYIFDSDANAGLYAPGRTLQTKEHGVNRTIFACLGSRSGYYTGISGMDSRPLLDQMLNTAIGEAGKLGAKIVSIQYLQSAEVVRLVEYGIIDKSELFLQTFSASLRIDGENFDEYLAGLNAGRRSVIQRDLTKYSESGFNTFIVRLSEAMDFAPSLLANVQQHHGEQGDIKLMTKMLSAQAKWLDDQSMVAVSVNSSNVPIAFSLSYIFDNVVYVRLVGMDYDYALPSAAYFVTAYYEPIRYALSIGVRDIHFGIGSLRPKLLRGASLEPLFGVFGEMGLDRKLEPLFPNAGASLKLRDDLISELSEAQREHAREMVTRIIGRDC